MTRPHIYHPLSFTNSIELGLWKSAQPVLTMCVGRSTLVGPGPTGPPKNGQSRRSFKKPEKMAGPVLASRPGQDL